MAARSSTKKPNRKDLLVVPYHQVQWYGVQSSLFPGVTFTGKTLADAKATLRAKASDTFRHEYKDWQLFDDEALDAYR